MTKRNVTTGLAGLAVFLLASTACGTNAGGGVTPGGDTDGETDGEYVPERVLQLQASLEAGSWHISAFRAPGVTDDEAGGPRSYYYQPDPLTPEGEKQLRLMISGPARVQGWDDWEVELLVERMKESAREKAREEGERK